VTGRAWLVPLLLVPSHALAAEVSEEVRFSYREHPSCPSYAAFRQQLLLRSDKVHFAAETGGSRTFAIELEQLPNGTFRGKLAIDGGSPRVLEASECAELVSALGLIAALAIDPQAKTDPLPLPADPPPSPPPPPALLAATPPAAPARVDPPRPPAAPSPRLWRWGLGGVGGVAFGHVSGAAGGGGVFVELRRNGRQILAPAFRVGAERTAPHTAAGDLASARFTWTHGRVEVCPIAWSPHMRIRVLPCAGMQIGAIEARDSTASSPKTAVRLWLAPVTAARFEGVMVADRLWLEIEGGAAWIATRDRFAVGPDDAAPGHTVYAPGSVAGLASLGLGVHIP
jgi:hypothetical protein